MSSPNLVSRPKIKASKGKKKGDQFTSKECGQKAAHVCAICEEGGDLLFCDGPCMRHFHTSNVSKGAETFCCPGLVTPLLQEGTWSCPDCVLKQAMCFSCGVCASFEGFEEEPPAIRQCPDPACIRFFCFNCLPAEKGVCAMHHCAVCRRPEVKSVEGMVFCLRCPTSWHFQCLKREQANGYCRHREIYSHSWAGNMRHMFYCHKHTIDPHLGTPMRDHVTSAICLAGGDA